MNDPRFAPIPENGPGRSRSAGLYLLLLTLGLAFLVSSLAAAAPQKAAGNRDKDLMAKVGKVLHGDLAGLDTIVLLGDVETALARKKGGAEVDKERLLEAAGALHFALGGFDGARRSL